MISVKTASGTVEINVFKFKASFKILQASKHLKITVTATNKYNRKNLITGLFQNSLEW